MKAADCLILLQSVPACRSNVVAWSKAREARSAASLLRSDVDSYERALELAGELSAAPGSGGKPIHEWLELRPFLAPPPTITE